MIPVQAANIERNATLLQRVEPPACVQPSKQNKQQCATDGTEIACGADCCAAKTQYCKEGVCINFKKDSAGAVTNCINTGDEFCLASADGHQFCVRGV